MSIGIRLHDSKQGTLADRAADVRSQGFECVHLAIGKVLGGEYMQPSAATPGLADYIRHSLNGLDVAVLGCYLNLAHPDESVYGQTLKTYFGQLQLMRWLGGGVVGTETGNPNAGYQYDPARSHTQEALDFFLKRLELVVRMAEKIGVTLAIEPVFTHIVHNGRRARQVLDAMASPNLKIILDPVNLLAPELTERREEIFQEATELLENEIAVIHLKDYRVLDGRLAACAAGTGEMDYTTVLRFAALKKPHIHMTLEDTVPENAAQACAHVRRLLSGINP